MLCYMNIDRCIQIEIIHCRDNRLFAIESTYSLSDFREIIFLRKAIKCLFLRIENICDNIVATNNIYFLVVHLLSAYRVAVGL